MAEIKSTLDIVLEKTRHLVMSDAEKEAQSKADAAKTLTGLLQKFVDQAMNSQQLQRGLRQWQKDYRQSDDDVITSVIGYVEPELPYQRLLEFLHAEFDAEIQPFRDVFRNYQVELGDKRDAQLSVHRNRLREQHAISGPAVLPNLGSDPEWKEIQEDLKERYRRKIRDQVARMHRRTD